MAPRPPSSDPDTGPEPHGAIARQPGADASVVRAQRRESHETQTKILDAAEALFVEMGFAATSLRAIAKRAGVNLAAAHYHFGSKEGLLGAAFHRAVAPLNAKRLRALDALETRAAPPELREIVEAFLAPLAAVEPNSAVPRLAGCVYREPGSVSKPLIEREFGEVAARFLGALGAVLPDLSPTTLRWRFSFVVGSMIHLLTFDPLSTPSDSPLAAIGRLEDGVAHLIDFAVSGLDPEHANA